MKIVVVGAGFAGVTAARELHRAGVDVTVLEAADRVGGRAHTVTSSLGTAVDLGGMWLGPKHHALSRLAAEYEVTTFPTPTQGRRRILDGRITSAWSALLVGGVALLRLSLPSTDDRTTIAHWLSRLPHPAARRLVEVVVAEALAADTDQVTRQAFASAVRSSGGLESMLGVSGGAQDSLLTGGAGALVARIAADLPVHLSRPATAITRTDSGVVVETPDGPVRADHAIIAVPPPVSALIHHDPPLPPSRALVEQNTVMGAIYKAIAVYERPFWRAAGLSGEVISLTGLVPAVFDVSPPDGPGHLGFLVPGHRARTLSELSVEDRKATLLDTAAQALGPAALTPVDWHEKSWHDDPHVQGGYSALPLPGRYAATRQSPTPIGRLHWAGTETSDAWPGYLEGAVRSGLRAAREVLQSGTEVTGRQ
ncbi:MULTISPECIES: flavin monoamine oxidase family protein [unclassified Saccharothrix]|uniref:flavin monoamine oxidase family protein n=1 Tax=unclassified Saccharothrix TaxID=2593673 RepID=UPI00307ED29B